MLAELRRKLASTKLATFLRRLVRGERVPVGANPLCRPVYSGAYGDKPGFLEAYEMGLKTIEPLGDAGDVFRYDMQRVYVCCWAAKHGLGLEGDFVECGVNTGFLSRAVMQYIEFEKHPSRNFHLLDTFTGLDVSQLSPGERALGFEEVNGLFSTTTASIHTFIREKLLTGLRKIWASTFWNCPQGKALLSRLWAFPNLTHAQKCRDPYLECLSLPRSEDY